MKVGDLVELSSYGDNLKMFSDYRGKIGLVIEIEDHIHSSYYSVFWPSASKPLTFYRRDLKCVK